MASGLESLKALVVEDNTHMRALLRALLNALGIKDILEAANGQTGLKLLQERQIDLVLTDLTMAPMDGLELTRHLRNDENSPNPFIPIIMITGHTERYRVEAARDAGVTEFLAKPITAHNLFARITEILEKPRAFVRCDNYFGPDRRRHNEIDTYGGPWRRADDLQNADAS
jgi:CheY-like chemotaxis protein